MRWRRHAVTRFARRQRCCRASTAFARYDWNSATGLSSGDRNWTVGVVASWSPFAGASELADVEATAGRAQAAQAQAEAARASAQLEIEQTRTALSVALTRLDIAEHAAAQSAEAHRIVSRKYGGGLAAVVELLDAQAAETQSALALSEARWSAIVAGRRKAPRARDSTPRRSRRSTTRAPLRRAMLKPAADSSQPPNEKSTP
jgi:hypothetical protein